VPLFAFATAALVSSAAAFFLPFPAFKGAVLLRSEFEALATLVVGICFYLVIAGWAGQPDRLRFLLRWINWGGVVMLGWSLFQPVGTILHGKKLKVCLGISLGSASLGIIRRWKATESPASSTPYS
jgi:hypothetical protein